MTLRKVVIIFISVLFFRGVAFAELTTSQIAKQYSHSVVTIVALDENDQPLAIGSGFFVNANGDIATNHHVLEGSTKAIIKTIDGKKGEILEIIKDDPELDLLIAKTSLENTAPLPLGDSDTITVGDDIVAIGNPAGLEGTVSKGIISGIRKAEDLKFIQITAPISPGSSGGPVFNVSGRVIGVATSYLDLGQNLNFAMPINYLKTLKPSGVRLGSLPKMGTEFEAGTDDSLVEIYDIHYNLDYNYISKVCNVDSVDFVIKNNSNYSIKNLRIFFVYFGKFNKVSSYSAKDIKSTILPKLALQFNHRHQVKHFCAYYYFGLQRDGSAQIRILDYEIVKSASSSPADLLFK